MEFVKLFFYIREWIESVYKNWTSIEFGMISLNSLIDQIIFEGIKEAFDLESKQKSIRLHMNENNMLSDDQKRKLSRQKQYSQYYRDEEYKRMQKKGFDVSELKGKYMTDISDKLSGHEITDMQFFELIQMDKLEILKKVTGKQICDSKKISNNRFVELFKQYDEFIERLFLKADSDEKIVFNLIAYFTLEWKYKFEYVYRLAKTAEQYNYRMLDTDRISLLCAELNIAPTPTLPIGKVMTQSRFIYERQFCIDLLFEMSNDEWEKEEIIFSELLRLKAMFKQIEYNGVNFSEYVSKSTTVKQRAEFIKEKYWIWKIREDREWNNKRIKYARELFNIIMMNIPIPKIK